MKGTYSEDGTVRLRTSVWIDLRALEENYRAIGRLLGPQVGMMCVIKADAYGHGAVEVGRRLESLGAAYFGVATIDEAKELREAGIRSPVLVLGGAMPWEGPELFIEYDLAVAVGNFELLDRIDGFRGGKPLKLHVKIDTGMGRLGFGTGEIPGLLSELTRLQGVEIEGIMSHFSRSERRDDYGLGQVALFAEAVGRFKEKGIEPRLIHMANSAGLCNYPEARFNMVRPGIMLYGSYPGKALCDAVELTPVLTWTASISFVRTFPAGTALSYGGTYVTERDTRVAYVPVGYSHGYPRALSNRGSVLVAGRRCGIVGAVCMDWSFVDVTGVPEAVPGQEVVLLGSAKGAKITADEIAGDVGTIPYEILCGVSKQIKRRHVH